MRGKARAAKRELALAKAPDLLKLDLGCGKTKQAGFIGVDIRKFDGVDQEVDLRQPWPWADNSVAQVFCAHFIEHLKPAERIHFVNELWRVLVPGGTATIIIPHFASCRAYGDLSHEWPPVSEMWFYYLDPTWRAQEAPHNDFYRCDFQVTWGYQYHPEIAVRSQEQVAFATNFYKEAIQDIHATFTKRAVAQESQGA